MALHERFERFSDEYIKFERIENPRHPRPDVCAFLMLHDLVPGTSDIISGSEHDEFFLDVDCEKLNAAASDEQIRDLVRCGVRHNNEYDCLVMFS
jgi:hypothetical protein